MMELVVHSEMRFNHLGKIIFSIDIASVWIWAVNLTREIHV